MRLSLRNILRWLASHTTSGKFRWLSFYAVSFLALFFWFKKPSSFFLPVNHHNRSLHTSTTSYGSSLPTEYHFQEDSDLLQHAINSTLGFQKVFAINLPTRPDRRDQLTLMASISKIDITYSDGTQYTHRSQTSKGLPSHTSSMPLGKLGCYRAHANIWRRIVEEDIKTALILEDDVDWDVDVKSSLARIRSPLKLLQKALVEGSSVQGTPNAEQLSDSSPGWDILRLGTCLDPAHTAKSHRKGVDIESPPYVLYEDPNATPREHTTFEHSATFDSYGIPLYSNRQGREVIAEPHRIIQLSNYPVCLHAYAVSKIGAAKLLHLTSQGFIDDANDLTIARLTQRGLLNSFTVIPSIFGQWKVQGWQGNSDIKRVMQKTLWNSLLLKKNAEDAELKTQGSAYDIERSVRLEVDRVLKGISDE